MASDDPLRALLAQRRARDLAGLDRLTGYAEARAMLADAMSRGDNEEETENGD